MGLWSRILSTMNGARLGWSGYNLRTITPFSGGDYGAYEARLSRYDLARAYYYNTIYDQLYAQAARVKSYERLYKFIRSIENPLPRAIGLYASYTYAGSLDTETFKKGALPLIFDNDAFEPALKQLFKWSNLNQQLGKFVSDATLLGDAGWWVVDDPFHQRVRLERVEMDTVRLLERDDVGNVKAVVFETAYTDGSPVEDYQPNKLGISLLTPGKEHAKSTIVTKEKYKTLRDGEPYAFYTDADGNPISEWNNEYGFVPFVTGYFEEGEGRWGQNCFFGVPRRQIDELNDQASLINDSIRNVIIPLLQAKGLSKASEINVVREDRDSMAIAYLPSAEASLEAVNIPLDIPAANANRMDTRAELARNLKVLKLENLESLGNLSGVAIENLLGDATSAIKQLRKNLDPAVARAIQMAVTIGGIRGYEGFTGFNADSFDNGEMDLSVDGERPVIDDTLSKQEKLTAYPQIAGQPPAIQQQMLRVIGLSEDDIERIVADAEAQQEQQTRAAVRGMADAMFNGQSNGANPNADNPQGTPAKASVLPVNAV